MAREIKLNEHLSRDFYVPPETKYCTPCSHNPLTQGAPYRACPAATMLLAICKKVDASYLNALIQDLPPWVMEDFLKKGLHHALDACEFGTARDFLIQGATVNSEAIRVAQSKGKAVEFIDLAVACGWNVNSPEGCDTILAKFVEYEPIVACLLRNGADPNYGRPRKGIPSPKAPDHESGYALDCAASISTTAIIDMLLGAGAKKEYSVALHEATASPKPNRYQIPMIEHLIRLGFDVNGTDWLVRGSSCLGTPLTTAIRFKMLERATFLVLQGASPYLEGFAGKSPIEFAKSQQEPEFVAMFLKHCPPDGRSGYNDASVPALFNRAM